MSAPAADALAELLSAHLDPDLPDAGRLLDVPPPTAARALELLPGDLPAARLNGVRPPMTWLVEYATLLGGRLVGALTAGRGLVTFDGIQVDAAVAPELAARVAADWPAAGDLHGALAAATAEIWTSWTAGWPTWRGPGTDLLARPLPARAAVVGLWWD
ncbi:MULTISPECIES: hypothetical protein [unclassified Blastococcus]